MSKFKFGDKVQVIGISEEEYRDNVLSGRNPFSVEQDDDVVIGDIGIVTCDENHQWITVIFESDPGNSFEIPSNQLMHQSDESEIKILNNVMKLQECKYGSKKYATLQQNIVFDKESIKVGCQRISKADSLSIAKDILEHFEVKV